MIIIINSLIIIEKN